MLLKLILDNPLYILKTSYTYTFRSDVLLYNFGRVCVSVCQTITFESLDVGSSYLHMRYISMESIVCEGHRVTVKDSGAQNVENYYPRTAISPVLSDIEL